MYVVYIVYVYMIYVVRMAADSDSEPGPPPEKVVKITWTAAEREDIHCKGRLLSKTGGY